MTARDYLRVLREGWIIIVACTVLATLGATFVTLTQKPVYQATSTLAVSTCVALENSPVCDPVGGMSYAIQRASIYSSTGESLPVLRRTLELTDAVSSRAALQESTVVAQIADSPVIDVTATSNDSTSAADIANALAQALVEYARESIDSFESEMATVNFSVISEAAPPTDPIDDAPRTMMLAIVLGLLIGLGLAFVRYFVGGRLRDRDDAETLTGIDVLANLPLGVSRNFSRSTRPALPDTVTDAYRRLQIAASVRIAKAEIHTLLVVAPVNEEISSSVAHGFAVAAAETGRRVVLIDLNFSNFDESPPGKPSEVGIVEVLKGSATLDAALRQVGNSSLFTLSVGAKTSDPSINLTSPRLEVILSEVRDRFDFVIVNAAPVLPTADALSAARFANGVLVVAAIGATKRNDLRESIRALELSGTTPIGLATVT